MMWFKDNHNFFLNEQKSLSKEYPELLFKRKNNQIYMIGNLRFNATFDEITIEDEYKIEIIFPDDYPDSPPTVKEIGEKIDRDYHKNSDNTLCLETEVEVYRRFSANKNIVHFINNLLVPYLYRYSFIKKYGSDPFPDRRHGVNGIIDYYEEKFGVDEIPKIIEILKHILKRKYRGHHMCPCGSHKRIRNCHAPTVVEIQKVPNKCIKTDFARLLAYHKKIQSLLSRSVI